MEFIRVGCNLRPNYLLDDYLINFKWEKGLNFGWLPCFFLLHSILRPFLVLLLFCVELFSKISYKSFEKFIESFKDFASISTFCEFVIFLDGKISSSDGIEIVIVIVIVI